MRVCGTAEAVPCYSASLPDPTATNITSGAEPPVLGQSHLIYMIAGQLHEREGKALTNSGPSGVSEDHERKRGEGCDDDENEKEGALVSEACVRSCSVSSF